MFLAGASDVEGRDVGFTRDLAEDVLELRVQRRPRDRRRLARRSLRGQHGEAIEQLRDVVEGAVLDLQVREPVVGVAHTLLQDGDVRAVPVGHRQTRGIVAGVVDAVAARHARQRLTKPDVGVVQVGLGIDRGHIGDY